MDERELFHLPDLNAVLVRNPPATFAVYAAGDSMQGAGIDDGDLLVVDRSIEPRSGDIVIAAVDGDFTVKRLWREGERVELRPENDRYPVIRPEGEGEWVFFGVVTFVVKRCARAAGG